MRVNLLHRKEREASSHALVLRMRGDIEAGRHRPPSRANQARRSRPPGPPVLSTVVAEVYGQPHHTYADLVRAAEGVAGRMREEKGVVDVDTSAEQDPRQLFFRTDREKAALNGISTEDVVQTLPWPWAAMRRARCMCRASRTSCPDPRGCRGRRARARPTCSPAHQGPGWRSGATGRTGSLRAGVVEQTIFHKNQERVVYVTAEMAGVGPAYPCWPFRSWFKKNPLPEGYRIDWKGEGEWKITVDVFRDLGLAFAAALLIIYMLLVYETGSYALPGVIMLSIPLTMIGIMPGFSC
jgi:multidrug efflux pump subunit AcrB